MSSPNEPMRLYSGEASITIEHVGSVHGTGEVVFGWGQHQQSPSIGRCPQMPASSFGPAPFNAIRALLNCLYALAEFECRLALLAVGLDPGLGWANRDASYRDSAALDLLEAVRPSVDAQLITLLKARTFSRREFAELPSGEVRVMPELARLLVSSMPMWERAAAHPASRIARILARLAGTRVRGPGAQLAGAREERGGGTMGRRVREADTQLLRLPMRVASVA